jgi:hypothetical protein
MMASLKMTTKRTMNLWRRMILLTTTILKTKTIVTFEVMIRTAVTISRDFTKTARDFGRSMTYRMNSSSFYFLVSGAHSQLYVYHMFNLAAREIN